MGELLRTVGARQVNPLRPIIRLCDRPPALRVFTHIGEARVDCPAAARQVVLCMVACIVAGSRPPSCLPAIRRACVGCRAFCNSEEYHGVIPSPVGQSKAMQLAHESSLSKVLHCVPKRGQATKLAIICGLRALGRRQMAAVDQNRLLNAST